MLPPFIIEQIRKREEEEARDDRPQLQLPLPQNESRPSDAPAEPNRGVIIIELGPGS